MASTIPLSRQFLRIKPADEITAEGEHTELKRSMGLLALTMFSVGSIVGTGIFVILGTAVPLAGPAVMVSFVLAGIAVRSPPSPTRSSPVRSPCPGRRTRTRTRPWASSSPGCAVGA